MLMQADFLLRANICSVNGLLNMAFDMMQEERDKENKLRTAQRQAQAKARADALRVQRSTEGTACLQAISSLRAAMKQQQQAPDRSSLAIVSAAHTEAESSGATQAEPAVATAAHKATGSVGTTALPVRHRRSASWVQRRASSLDDASAAALAGALLAGPRAAHQKSSSHESGLPGKLPALGKQPSRLSSATADSMADGGELQARPAQSSVRCPDTKCPLFCAEVCS